MFSKKNVQPIHPPKEILKKRHLQTTSKKQNKQQRAQFDCRWISNHDTVPGSVASSTTNPGTCVQYFGGNCPELPSGAGLWKKLWKKESLIFLDLLLPEFPYLFLRLFQSSISSGFRWMICSIFQYKKFGPRSTRFGPHKYGSTKLKVRIKNRVTFIYLFIFFKWPIHLANSESNTWVGWSSPEICDFTIER